MKINPIELVGPWDEGFALDVYTKSSTYIEDDVFGHPVFDTKYSDMGKLINGFKHGRKDYDLLNDIIALAEPFIKTWQNILNIKSVLSVPPSKKRLYQPAEEIAREIADLIGVYYIENVFTKESSIESKGLSVENKKQVIGTIIKTKTATKEHDTLLIDDVYKSGETMKECVRLLREDPLIKKIYVLAMTKTRT